MVSLVPARGASDLADRHRSRRPNCRARVAADCIAFPPGQVIAHLPRFGVESDASLCNYRTGHGGNAVVTWESGKADFGNWRSEFGPIFFDLLHDRGVRVVGDPKALFRQDEEAGAAEILVGARIHEIRGNFCEATNLWDGYPLGEYSGEMFVRVQWPPCGCNSCRPPSGSGAIDRRAVHR